MMKYIYKKELGKKIKINLSKPCKFKLNSQIYNLLIR
jgi:hypothetical protein